MASFNEKGFLVELEEKEVFVFGSNLKGLHIGGAARQAYEDFGAIWGVGVGRQGQSYAIPTMELDVDNISLYVSQFIDYALLTPELTYYVTPIGTGIASMRKEEMEAMWSRFDLPDNVKLL
jgi:hypothetical protein